MIHNHRVPLFDKRNGKKIVSQGIVTFCRHFYAVVIFLKTNFLQFKYKC